MSKKTDVFCDSCNKEISTTAYASEFYISLSTTPKRNASGFSYAMALSPPFNTAKDFCGIGCLKKWLSPQSEVN